MVSLLGLDLGFGSGSGLVQNKIKREKKRVKNNLHPKIKIFAYCTLEIVFSLFIAPSNNLKSLFIKYFIIYTPDKLMN